MAQNPSTLISSFSRRVAAPCRPETSRRPCLKLTHRYCFDFCWNREKINSNSLTIVAPRLHGKNFCSPIYPLGDHPLQLNCGVPLMSLHCLQFLPSPSPPIFASRTVIDCQPLIPQAYLGLTFNWGDLLGWVAVTEILDPAVVLHLYASGVFWTLVYDTIYSHQDKEDDLRVGIKSTALWFGHSTEKWVIGFGIACISSLALSGYNVNLAWPYFVLNGYICPVSLADHDD